MRIYTKAGDLAFEEFTFPDGQPHFKLLTLDSGFLEARIETSIKRADDILRVSLAADVLQRRGFRVDLDIRWLMGARMDRAISNWEPFTLSRVLDQLAVCRFTRMRVLDLHNPKSTAMLHNVLPFNAVKQTFDSLDRPLVVIPDKGATDRVTTLVKGLQVEDIVQCTKRRDLNVIRVTWSPEKYAWANLAKLEAGNPFRGEVKLSFDGDALKLTADRTVVIPFETLRKQISAVAD